MFLTLATCLRRYGRKMGTLNLQKDKKELKSDKREFNILFVTVFVAVTSRQ